jgi:hypothetical protein
MSGGHFDYAQFKIEQIADRIEDLIWCNSLYSEETMDEFNKAIKALRIAYVYAQRVDWLISGDDGEETFHQRLAVDLSEIV